MPRHMALSGGTGIHVRALLFVPEAALDLFQQFRLFRLVGFFLALRREPGHHAQSRREEHLLRAERAVAVKVRPVHEHPVLLPPGQEAVFIPLAQQEGHEALRLRPHAIQVFPVAVRVEMLLQAEDPQQGVIHDGIDVGGDRIVAPERRQRALFDLAVTGQVPVHKQGLVGVAAPDPLVALDPVQEEYVAAQREGMGSHLKNAVQLLIVTLEGCPYRDIHELMNGAHPDRFRRNTQQESVAQGLPRAAMGQSVRTAEVIALRRIQGFRSGFPQVNQRRLQARLKGHHFQRCGQLSLKSVQRSAVHRFHAHRFVHRFTHGPDVHLLVRLRKVPVGSRRNRGQAVILRQPAVIRANHVALNIDRRHAADAPDMHRDRNIPGAADDLRPHRVFAAVHPHKSGRVRRSEHSEGRHRLQLIIPLENHAVPEAFALPESRPGKAALHPGKILFHRVIQFQIPGIPDPPCFVSTHISVSLHSISADALRSPSVTVTRTMPDCPARTTA